MKTHYVLDSSNRIVGTGDDWDEFARENRAPGAASSEVLGRNLFSFVDGKATAQFLNQIFFACRRNGSAFSQLCRCDAPFIQRLYRMEVTPLPANRLRVRHVELETVRFKPGARLSRLSRENDPHRCSQCCGIEIGGNWIDSFFTPAEKHVIQTYSICDPCKQKALHGLSFAAQPADNLISFQEKRRAMR